MPYSKRGDVGGEKTERGASVPSGDLMGEEPAAVIEVILEIVIDVVRVHTLVACSQRCLDEFSSYGPMIPPAIVRTGTPEAFEPFPGSVDRVFSLSLLPKFEVILPTRLGAEEFWFFGNPAGSVWCLCIVIVSIGT